MRLRTQLVIACVALIAALSVASFVIVQRTVLRHVRKQVGDSVTASERVLRSVQADREMQLSRTAALMSELPTLKALLATQHRSTVQDGSEPFWKTSGGDVFVLASPDGTLLAKHFSEDGWTDEAVSRALRASLENGDIASWWSDHGRLYWVFFHVLRAGAGAEARDLGFVIVGYDVDQDLAQRLADSARSEIAIDSDGMVIASTLDKLAATTVVAATSGTAADEVSSSGRSFAVRKVELHAANPRVVCTVMVPLDESKAFLRRLDFTIVTLGLAALVIGGILFTFISRAITRPLEKVIAGVRALAGGDYNYEVEGSGSTEVDDLSRAFSAMRPKLLASQKNQLAAERVAILGRTASSISHDLRHYLAAVMANAEYLYEPTSPSLDRDEIYREIRLGTEQMVDLIESLRGLSREEPSLQPVRADLAVCIRRAIETVSSRPAFDGCEIVFDCERDLMGVFDPLKLERAILNLLVNACEAVAGRAGHIEVRAACTEREFQLRMIDNGPGITPSVRENLFEPFITSGKPNGTGLGLAIVRKVMHDHGGTVEVERTSASGTTMLVRMPRVYSAADEVAAAAYGTLYDGAGS